MKTMGIVFSNIHDDNLRELTSLRTLASVPFAGRYRLIDFVLSSMVNSNISKVGLITKNNYQSLMDHVGSGKNWDLSRKNGGLMILPPYGAGNGVYESRFDALKNAVNFIRRSTEEYVVMSDCDLVCNIDYNKIISRHIANRADITVVYYTADHKAGSMRTQLDIDENGRVYKVSTSNRVCGMGNYFGNILVMNTKFLLNIIDNADELDYKSFSRDVLIKGAPLYRIFGHKIEGFFALIDSLESYYNQSMELLKKEKRDLLFRSGAPVYTKVRDSAPCKIENGGIIKNSLVADGCVIQGEVENSILFRGVKVSKGSKIVGSIVMQDAIIGQNSTLNCVIADKNAVILDKRTLSGHSTHPYYISKNSII